LFYSFASFILGLLHSGTLAQGIIDAIQYFWGVLNSFSYIFPVGTLLAALLIVLAFDLAVMAWHFLQWIIRKIPGMH